MKKLTAATLLGGAALVAGMLTAPLAAADSQEPPLPNQHGHYMTPLGPNPNVFYGTNPLVIPGAALPT